MTDDERGERDAPGDASTVQWPSGDAAAGWGTPPAPDQWSAPGATPPAPAQPAPHPGPLGYHSPAPGSVPMPPPPAAAPSFRSWQPGIIPLRPLNFGDFLTVPFKAMRFNRAVVLGAPLLFTLISTIIVLVTLWLIFTDPQLGLLNTIPTMSGISGTTIAMIIVSILMMLLADVFSSSIIAPGVARAVLGEKIGIPVAWRQMRRRLGSLLLLYAASATLLTVLLLIAFLPMIISLAAGDGSPAATIVSIILAFVLLLPGGMLVTLWQGAARAMIVLEGISVIAALKRLPRLMRGRFWWSILIIFVSSLLINVVSSVLQYVGQFGALGAVLVAPDNTAVLLVAIFVIYGLAYILSLVLVYSYLGSVFALIYIDLRMRHEGFDLDLARAAEERARR